MVSFPMAWTNERNESEKKRSNKHFTVCDCYSICDVVRFTYSCCFLVLFTIKLRLRIYHSHWPITKYWPLWKSICMCATIRLYFESYLHACAMQISSVIRNTENIKKSEPRTFRYNYANRWNFNWIFAILHIHHMPGNNQMLR